MFALSQTGRLAVLGVAIPTTALLIYWLLKSNDDDEESEKREPDRRGVTSRQTVIEMSVPSSVAGQIIGRQGSKIKELQEKSGARINFKDDKRDDKKAERQLIIRGTAEAAQIAECMILELLANIPEQGQEEIQVPGYVIGRIIGKGGDTIRSLCRGSNAKIYVDRTREDSREKPRQITISGSKEQIAMAKSLIQEKIDEEDAFRAKAAVSAANRQIRQHPVRHAPTSHIQDEQIPGVSPLNEVWDNVQRCAEFPRINDYVNVYVSAIAHPGHFWVQMVTQQSVRLDELSDKMTRYYSIHSKDLILHTAKVGDLVAAPFENDDTWYRAKVMEVKGRELDLFFIDYGDSSYVDMSKACRMSPEFLELPFQAIECRLAGVKPTGEWTDDAFDRFESLTYCAKWKVVVARAETFDGSIPHLTLIDTNGPKDVNINQVMVQEGFAVLDT